MRCAELYKTNLKEPHDEAMAYDHAAKAFKNCNTKGEHAGPCKIFWLLGCF